LKLNEIVGLTPAQKLNALIIHNACEMLEIEQPELDEGQDFDEFVDEFNDQNGEYMYDAMSELRCSGDATGLLPAVSSRHYEIDSVAAEMLDGSYVEWAYFHGGGKHSEPEAFDWIGNARNVSCKSRERVVIVSEYALI
jgi:hypothetical protein